jgi:N-acetylmuramic acid 6-phosphate etherase
MSQFSYEQFKQIASEFQLGKLTTESFHPETKNLSYDAKSNLEKALQSLKLVDQGALTQLKKYAHEIFQLHQAIRRVRHEGGRIFLSGCGATGRLSLAVETFARRMGQQDVIGFMAGGDFALIRSVESFEDRMSYGAHQLAELGFGEKDLLLAITEGGETSFVIGSALSAVKLSSQKPYFLYCNPDEQLLGLERCRDVLLNDNVIKLNLTIGPMALSGSTRMQATTVQMLACGIAILYNFSDEAAFLTKFNQIIDSLHKLDYAFLAPFIEEEAGIYQKGEYLTYETSADLAISILTDTTERSPTFSLLPFEQTGQMDLALAYMIIQMTESSEQAWKAMLMREPRALNWGQLNDQINLSQIYKYDISQKSFIRRGAIKTQHPFRITSENFALSFSLKDLQHTLASLDDFFTMQLALKIWLNALSTLIMGRLERYESNMMTWVKPSNYKLIDRASRYVQKLGEQEGFHFNYDQVVKTVIELSDQLRSDEPIVLKALKAIKQQHCL